MPRSRDYNARYRAKLAADPARVAQRREYQRAYYQRTRAARQANYVEHRAARLAYQHAYYARHAARLRRAARRRARRLAAELRALRRIATPAQLEARAAARRASQRAYYRRNRAARLAYARAYSARVKPPREAAAPPPPPREAAAQAPRRDATLDPIGVLHARLVALAPAYAWRIFDDGVVGRDGKVKLRVLVSGVIYVGAERKNLKKWLQSIGVSGEIVL